MKCKSELIYFINNIPRQLHESSCLRSAQDWTINIGEYHWLFIIMSLLWNNKIYEIKYDLWVLPLEWIEKYQK